ncbi:MAG TPA: DNA-binding protein [Fluviicoccus sp.]|nr:DNA-binding protein [Fluviicoccus sp.]
MSDKPLSEKDLSIRWGVSVRTLKAWRAEGIGPKWTVLGKNTVRYRMEDIAAYEADRIKTNPEEKTND